jgi:hypothetical protein
MAANPTKPQKPTPPALPRGAPITPSRSRLVAKEPRVEQDAPLITASELAELRARLAHAEARVKELIAAAAQPSQQASLIAPRPGELDTRPAVAPPAMSPATFVLAQALPASPAAPIVRSPAIPVTFSSAPAGPVSIIPFDGAKKRRRSMIVVVTTLLVIIAGIVTVMIASRAMH